MEVKIPDQTLGKLDPSHSITQGIQGRRPKPDSHDIGNDQDKCARHSTFGWKSHIESELTGIIVHATGVHEGKNVTHGLGVQGGVRGCGANSAVG